MKNIVNKLLMLAVVLFCISNAVSTQVPDKMMYTKSGNVWSYTQSSVLKEVSGAIIQANREFIANIVLAGTSNTLALKKAFACVNLYFEERFNKDEFNQIDTETLARMGITLGMLEAAGKTTLDVQVPGTKLLLEIGKALYASMQNDKKNIAHEITKEQYMPFIEARFAKLAEKIKQNSYDIGKIVVPLSVSETLRKNDGNVKKTVEENLKETMNDRFGSDFTTKEDGKFSKTNESMYQSAQEIMNKYFETKQTGQMNPKILDAATLKALLSEKHAFSDAEKNWLIFSGAVMAKIENPLLTAEHAADIGAMKVFQQLYWCGNFLEQLNQGLKERINDVKLYMTIMAPWLKVGGYLTPFEKLKSAIEQTKIGADLEEYYIPQIKTEKDAKEGEITAPYKMISARMYNNNGYKDDNCGIYSVTFSSNPELANAVRGSNEYKQATGRADLTSLDLNRKVDGRLVGRQLITFAGPSRESPDDKRMFQPKQNQHVRNISGRANEWEIVSQILSANIVQFDQSKERQTINLPQLNYGKDVYSNLTCQRPLTLDYPDFYDYIDELNTLYQRFTGGHFGGHFQIIVPYDDIITALKAIRHRAI